ncbi:hypothetical protein U9M48_032305 [Paspalum notatum var. saurae]|uniref:Uncharacterized protein n=1 Tax=Paspalum notatum var. saurae TaxID=547442 RepID=A0AAQ3U4S2_PASNO
MPKERTRRYGHQLERYLRHLRSWVRLPLGANYSGRNYRVGQRWSVLFETPSGFAILDYDGVTLRLPGAIEDVWAAWLKEFQTFEDRASAINPVTGINEQLAMMIQNNIDPDGQKLAVVGYQFCCGFHQGIVCMFDETVMELMWGLKNCMHHLAELTKEDRLHMCQGMKIVLDCYKFEVEPEMVNENIIQATGGVYSCELLVRKYSQSLQAAGKHLKEISNIDSQHWDLLKLAPPLKIICFPQEKLPSDPLKIFSQDEYSKLVSQAHMYEGKLSKGRCKLAFIEIV